eukprot:Gb_20211 [translate_table: standard]
MKQSSLIAAIDIVSGDSLMQSMVGIMARLDISGESYISEISSVAYGLSFQEEKPVLLALSDNEPLAMVHEGKLQGGYIQSVDYDTWNPASTHFTSAPHSSIQVASQPKPTMAHATNPGKEIMIASTSDDRPKKRFLVTDFMKLGSIKDFEKAYVLWKKGYNFLIRLKNNYNEGIFPGDKKNLLEGEFKSQLDSLFDPFNVERFPYELPSIAILKEDLRKEAEESKTKAIEQAEDFDMNVEESVAELVNKSVSKALESLLARETRTIFPKHWYGASSEFCDICAAIAKVGIIPPKKSSSRRPKTNQWLAVFDPADYCILCFSKRSIGILDGLNFIPRPPPMAPESVRKEFGAFCKVLHLRWFFGPRGKPVSNNDKDEDFISPFRVPMPFWTPDDVYPPLERIIKIGSDLLQSRLQSIPCHQSSMLPPRFRRALSSLRNDQSIIIQPADKNLGLAILDRDWYIGEGLRQMSNQRVYEEVPTVPWRAMFNNLRALTLQLKGGSILPDSERVFA